MSIAKNIQTMQAFLGYFNPAEAKRMARGCRPQTGGEAVTTRVDPAATVKEQVSNKKLLQELAALQDVFPDWAVTIEDTIVEGDKAAVRLTVAGL